MPRVPGMPSVGRLGLALPPQAAQQQVQIVEETILHQVGFGLQEGEDGAGILRFAVPGGRAYTIALSPEGRQNLIKVLKGEPVTTIQVAPGGTLPG